MYDINFVMMISFRDNKIKIDAPTFEGVNMSQDKPHRFTMSGSNRGFGNEVTHGLFKKNGEPSFENAIIQLEDFFNNYCLEICREASGISKEEEW